MLKIKDNKEFDYVETTRLQSIHKQLGDLLNRLKLVRNVIVSFISGIFLFIITSLIIGLEIFTGIKPFDFLKTVFFGLGMISVGLGMIFSLIETLRGFKIVELEVKADE